MNHPLPPYLMHGIELAQAGRKIEALPYLRHAARTEPIPADGWLWLAAATDDLEEYRHCVNMALHLAPGHPVAMKMQVALHRAAGYGGEAYGGGYAPGSGGYPAYPAPEPTMIQSGTGPQRVRRRRWLRWLVLLVILGACGAGAVALIASGVLEDAADDLLTDDNARAINFTVGDAPGFRFEVAVPETWLPANTDNPSWRTTHDELAEAFPVPENQIDVWSQVEESFSAAVRDPVYGRIIPAVRIVETDPSALERDGLVAALTLYEIVPYPPAPDDDADANGNGDASATRDICDLMARVSDTWQADAALTGGANVTVRALRVASRSGPGGGADDCIVRLERSLTNQPAADVPFPVTIQRAPSAVREVRLAIPAGEGRYALWIVTLADASADEYAAAVDAIAQSLVYLPS